MPNEDLEEERSTHKEHSHQHGLFHRLHQWFIGTAYEPGRYEVKPSAESHFSWLRTRMSMERTIMSWIRTSTALIGFGFTIVQFFHSVPNLSDTHEALRHPEMARYMGLALIASGVFALVISLWQYRAFARYLWNKDFEPLAGIAKAPVETPAFGIALCLIMIGCYAFLAVLIRAV